MLFWAKSEINLTLCLGTLTRLGNVLYLNNLNIQTFAYIKQFERG
ncbi:hypothetical protein BH10CYA1_BH10CYA1_61710 [soil metagenome]